MREVHVPAQHPETQEAPRVPVPHAYSRRPGRAQGPSPSRPHAPLGLIRRVRGRATFAALAGAARHTRGPVTVRCVSAGENGPPRVAFAVGRGTGSAVARNRVRRRLRAATAACEGSLEGGAAYLVSAGRGALTMPFTELVETLGDLFESSAPDAGTRR
jgi:ribonuclease P protein component